MKPYRKRIDDLDDQIVDLLVAREEVIKEVAIIKVEHNIPFIIQSRIDEVKNRCMERAKSQGASSEIIEKLYTALINFSCDLEDEIAKEISTIEKQNGQS